MAYCEDKAIPHSKFLEEWSPEDRAKLLAQRLERGEKCYRCNTAPWEWDENSYAYEPVVSRCIGCMKLDTARKDVSDTSAQVVLVPAAKAAMLRDAPKRRPRGRHERTRT